MSAFEDRGNPHHQRGQEGQSWSTSRRARLSGS